MLNLKAADHYQDYARPSERKDFTKRFEQRVYGTPELLIAFTCGWRRNVLGGALEKFE